MSMQALREFINRHNTHAAGLAALGAALDAKVSGAPLSPALAECVQELLAALGAGDILADVTAEQAMPLVPEIRHQLGFNAKLLYPETRASSWSYGDTQLLQDVGDFASWHAHAITRNVVPALEGMAQRFGSPGATFLDIGVGVAGTAIALAQQWPELHIVGVDVWAPSLALARDNVEKADLRDRIELREQGAENMEDDKAFDLAWMPIPFMPGKVIPQAAAGMHRAVRPGGWAIIAFVNLEGMDAATAALWKLRVTTWGGPLLSREEVERLLSDQGFTDVRTMPRPPGSPVGLAVGRRKPA